MKLTLQKRLSASVLRCSRKRVVFDPSRLEDVKEAITKTDIRMLVGEGVIKGRPKKGVSRVRANKRKTQRRKGLRKGEGKRKGKSTAREPKKEVWMKAIRAKRKFLTHLRGSGLIKPETFKDLYKKSGGGFFRSTNHIKLYISEHNLLLKRTKGEASKTSKAVKKDMDKKDKKQKTKQSGGQPDSQSPGPKKAVAKPKKK